MSDAKGLEVKKVDTKVLDAKIAFIGGGNMAQALIAGLLQQGQPATSIYVAEPVVELQSRLASLGINVATDTVQMISQADVVLLAVKPQVINTVLTELSDALQGKLLISIAAGVSVAQLSAPLNGHERIIRCMPNTPSVVQEGASGLYAPATVNDSDRQLAQGVLEASGLVTWVDTESQLHAVTAVSGSGPAYFFYLMEAMIEGGIAQGLSPELARQLVLQTAFGSAKMALESDLQPNELRKNVTSPNGTTQAATEHLDAMLVKQHVQGAVAAADLRSKQLAGEA